MTYYVLHKDGLLVGVHPNSDVNLLGLPGVNIDEIVGEIPNLNHVSWDPVELQLINNSQNLSKLDFLSRFTSPERIASQTSTDPILKDALALLQMADYIDVTDQRTMILVGYMAMTGIILNERVAQILS